MYSMHVLFANREGVIFILSPSPPPIYDTKKLHLLKDAAPVCRLHNDKEDIKTRKEKYIAGSDDLLFDI